MGRRLWRSDNLSPFTVTPQAWVQSMDTLKACNVGLIDLHPEVFRAPPRLDILKRNLNWQDDYRKVVLTKSISRGEMVGGGRKPWPQKKSGRARAGSIRAPFFFRGGLSKGVRGPLTYFYMLPYADRIHGLCIALTIKHMQDDLVIVDSLDNIPLHDEIGNTEFQRTEHNHSMCDEALRLHEIADVRNWGYSVLFVDAKDVAPRNLALACQDIPTFNMLPTYGLNCQSMMKHDTLVMTVDAVHIIENQLLKGMHRAQRERYQYKNFKQRIIEEGAEDDDEPGASRPPNVIW